ncbi:MAG: hypothetical protein PVG39_01840 [Desulfobacteraceae bacterium]|jgi:sensor domain CHASE-containing protein
MNSQAHDSPDSKTDITNNIEHLKNEIDEFLSSYLPGSPVLSSSKVVHDSLWGTLKLTPAELCFIDTPLVQRLRQIRQTGFAYLTFPSTTHSRFEHTLGVILNGNYSPLSV